MAAEAVEVELMADALERGARHHAEHGPKAACGCPARFDGTDPYLHRDGCPAGPQPLWELGLKSDEVRCKLCGHGSDSHWYPETCVECPRKVCQA